MSALQAWYAVASAVNIMVCLSFRMIMFVSMYFSSNIFFIIWNLAVTACVKQHLQTTVLS